MSNEVLIIGGKRHGETLRVPDSAPYLTMADYRSDIRAFDYGGNATISSRSGRVDYTLERVPVGSRHVTIARHPDLLRDTAVRVASDMIMAAFKADRPKARYIV